MNPNLPSKSAIEAQYQECGGSVTSKNAAKEENPAYQSVDVAAARASTHQSGVQSLEPNQHLFCQATTIMWSKLATFKFIPFQL